MKYGRPSPSVVRLMSRAWSPLPLPALATASRVERFRESSKQQGYSCQTLLPIDHKQWGLMRDLG